MKNEKKPFANTENVGGVAISEISMMFLKCEAMLNDVFECLADMEDDETIKQFDFTRCVCAALGKLSDAQLAVEDLHTDYSHEIQSKSKYKFI